MRPPTPSREEDALSLGPWGRVFQPQRHCKSSPRVPAVNYSQYPQCSCSLAFNGDGKIPTIPFFKEKRKSLVSFLHQQATKLGAFIGLSGTREISTWFISSVSSRDVWLQKTSLVVVGNCCRLLRLTAVFCLHIPPSTLIIPALRTG